MKLDDYIKANNVESSVADTLKKEFKSMCIIDIERYSQDVQKRMFKRAEELTVKKILDDFFYEAKEEGKIHEITVNFGLVPPYIDKRFYGKHFVLRKTEKGVEGCFYRVS